MSTARGPRLSSPVSAGCTRALLALLAVVAPVALVACRRARPQPQPPLAPPFAQTPLHAVVTGAGALLTPPSQPVTRPARRGPDADLIDEGWQGRTATAAGPSGSVAGVVEQRSVVRGHVLERDQVYRLGGGRWSLALQLTQALAVDAGEAGARVRAVDLLGDGRPFLVFVFPESGSATGPNERAVDVVDSSGALAVHRELYFGGVARASGGGLETWSLVPATRRQLFRHEVDRPEGGAWVAEVSDLVTLGAVPAAPQRL